MLIFICYNNKSENVCTVPILETIKHCSWAIWQTLVKVQKHKKIYICSWSATGITYSQKPVRYLTAWNAKNWLKLQHVWKNLKPTSSTLVLKNLSLHIGVFSAFLCMSFITDKWHKLFKYTCILYLYCKYDHKLFKYN